LIADLINLYFSWKRFYQKIGIIFRKIERFTLLLYQPASGYRYNSDSIFLYDFIRSFGLKGKVLDVGCGVGVLSALMARDFDIELSVIDKQNIALKYAKKNFEINSIEAKIYEGDFIEMSFGEKFDFIISNPPFYTSSVIQSQNSSLNISRYSHHLPLNSLIEKVRKILKPRGYFIFCYDAKQSDRVIFELKRGKLQPEMIRFIHPKVTKVAKLIILSARANSKSLCKIDAPLILFDEKNGYYREIKEIFKKTDIYSLTASF
jgi:tRNA1(Val) A37 N6-methylase TrmN6